MGRGEFPGGASGCDRVHGVGRCRCERQMKRDLVRIRLEPLAVEFDAPRDASLLSSLAAHGIEFPCGGEGICGGCRVRVLTGWLPITSADREHFSPRSEEHT